MTVPIRIADVDVGVSVAAEASDVLLIACPEGCLELRHIASFISWNLTILQEDRPQSALASSR